MKNAKSQTKNRCHFSSRPPGKDTGSDDLFLSQPTLVVSGLLDDFLLLLGSLSLDLLKAVEGFGEVILEGVELEPPLTLFRGGTSPLRPHSYVQVLQVLGRVLE